MGRGTGGAQSKDTQIVLEETILRRDGLPPLFSGRFWRGIRTGARAAEFLGGPQTDCSDAQGSRLRPERLSPCVSLLAFPWLGRGACSLPVRLSEAPWESAGTGKAQGRRSPECHPRGPRPKGPAEGEARDTRFASTPWLWVESVHNPHQRAWTRHVVPATR